MIRLIILFLTSALRLLRGKPRADSPAPLDISAGTNATGTFTDRVRGRRIPFRVYSPVGLNQPAPVVLFSPGLGGSRDAAPYLGLALAKAGYVAIFLQHPGSDSALLKGAADGQEVRKRLKAVTSDPSSAAARYGDIPFVVDQIERMAVEGRFAGKIDPTRIPKAKLKKIPSSQACGEFAGASVKSAAGLSNCLSTPGRMIHQPSSAYRGSGSGESADAPVATERAPGQTI